MRTGLLATTVLLAMSACAEWPDVETPLTLRQTGGWPELQPTAALPTPATTDGEEQLASTSLQARAAALRRRAILMRTPVADIDDFERLRAALAQ